MQGKVQQNANQQPTTHAYSAAQPSSFMSATRPSHAFQMSSHAAMSSSMASSVKVLAHSESGSERIHSTPHLSPRFARLKV